MGWTSSPRWYTPTVLRQEFVKDINPDKFTVIGWIGSWLKCINKTTNRPVVANVKIRRFRKNEYGYKDVLSTSGPAEVSQSAAKWLRSELAKRNLAPANESEASWLLRCDRAARYAEQLKAIQPGSVISAIEPFETTHGYQFNVGDKFTVKKVCRRVIYCTSAVHSWAYFKLDSHLFIPMRLWDDYPLVAV